MFRVFQDKKASDNKIIEAIRVKTTDEIFTLGSAMAVIREKIPKTSITFLLFLWVSGIEPESSEWKSEIITAIWYSY